MKLNSRNFHDEWNIEMEWSGKCFVHLYLFISCSRNSYAFFLFHCHFVYRLSSIKNNFNMKKRKKIVQGRNEDHFSCCAVEATCTFFNVWKWIQLKNEITNLFSEGNGMKLYSNDFLNNKMEKKKKEKKRRKSFLFSTTF